MRREAWGATRRIAPCCGRSRPRRIVGVVTATAVAAMSVASVAATSARRWSATVRAAPPPRTPRPRR
eukprot:9481637-Pyramimonas_sp.AAC.3